MNVLTALAALAALLPALGFAWRLIPSRRAAVAAVAPRGRKPRNARKKAPRRRANETSDKE